MIPTPQLKDIELLLNGISGAVREWVQKTSKKPQNSMGALAFCFPARNKYVFPVIDQMRNLFRFLDCNFSWVCHT